MRPHRQKPTRLPHPWDSPGKNTGLGFHFLLQCMKVKSENEVTQLCQTLSEPMDCSLPGSTVHGIFQARVLGWGAIAFSACWDEDLIKEGVSWPGQPFDINCQNVLSSRTPELLTRDDFLNESCLMKMQQSAMLWGWRAGDRKNFQDIWAKNSSKQATTPPPTKTWAKLSKTIAHSSGEKTCNSWETYWRVSIESVTQW